MIDIYAVYIDRSLEKEQFEVLLKNVSNQRKENIKRFIRLEDAQRSLIGEILARYCIGTKFGIANNDITFQKSKYGKPFILHPTGIHFNVSHSGNWVVCAVSNCPVGIDVEQIKLIDLDISKRFFSPEEHEFLMNIDESEQLDHFYKFWTLKESYIKAIGKGLSIPLDLFTIIMDNHNIKVQVEGRIEKYFFDLKKLDKDYFLAVCASNSKFNFIPILDFSQLYDKILEKF